MGSAHARRAYWDLAAALVAAVGVPGRPPGGRMVNTPRAYALASDADLMSWSAGGDARAFDEVVTRHGPLALRVARRLVDDTAAAEDVVQEAMVRLWSQAARFDAERAQLSTWLYRIVSNLAIDHRRRWKSDRTVALPEDFDIADPTPNVEKTLQADQQHAALDAAIQALPPRHRMAVALVYQEGVSGAEAARLLGLSAKAVERLLARARASLRAEMVR